MRPVWLVLAVCAASTSTPQIDTVPAITTEKLDWVQQFREFAGQKLLAAAASASPLNSKVSNYRYNHNDADLRAWTKYLVETHKAQVSRTSAAAAEFDIEAFIDYLVRQKNFREKDLQFLRRPGLDYGQEQIERELTKIKQKQEEEESKTISIGGEIIEGGALCVGYSYYAVVGFAIFCML